MKTRSPRSSFHQAVVTWSGGAPLDLAREREGAAAHDGELPPRLDSTGDVDTAVARRLRPAGPAHLGQRLAHDGGDPLPVLERRARLRVDVDPQLVGPVDVGAPRRPRMEVDDGQVRRPRDLGDLGHAELVGVPAGRKRDCRDLDPVGPLRRHPLLVDHLALDPVREAAQLRRPLVERAHDPFADREVVLDEIHLRLLPRREEHLVRVRHLDDPLPHLELDERRRHLSGPYLVIVSRFSPFDPGDRHAQARHVPGRPRFRRVSRGLRLRRRCGHGGNGGDDRWAAATADCATESLATVTDGRLTIGTDNPAFPPWFEGGTPEGSDWEINDPASGEGFESAVAHAVAEQLGFAEDDVDWVVVPFNNSFRPGDKNFDLDINQISVTEERDRAVDFSDSYYDVNQALVGLADTPIANATTLADLADYQLGAQVGTTSLQYVQDTIQPSKEPRVYDTSNDVVSALNGKQIDGIVVDLPTAFFLVGSGEVKNGTVVGQFPSTGGQEHFGMLFEEGNPLRDCVNEALATLKDDGTLAEIQQQWLSEKTSAPVIE